MGQSLYLAPHKKQLSVACGCVNRHRSWGGETMHQSLSFAQWIEMQGVGRA